MQVIFFKDALKISEELWAPQSEPENHLMAFAGRLETSWIACL